MSNLIQSGIAFDMSGLWNSAKNVTLVGQRPTDIENEINVAYDHNLSANEAMHDSDDKKLLCKLDLHLIPTMTLLYLLSFLDRVNIGQAKLNGLLVSLKLSSVEYNTCLSVFFVTYFVFEIPSNLILKKFRPSRWIPLIMIAWGTVTTCMGLVNSYQSLLVCRFLLGATESGLFPGATFYLSSWYKRRELSWRVSSLFSAAALGGAFGGVLAYGINKMDGLGGQEGWRWIFYVEGMVTVVVGVLAFFIIHDFPSDRPRFLNEQECDRVLTRLHADAGAGASEHFSWTQVCSAFSDWKIYIWSLGFMGVSVPFFSLSLFSPTIVQSLGFVTYQAQLLTTPPYAFSFITTMVTAYFSDKYARRAIFILFWLIISIIGCVILIVVQNLNVKYFAVFLVTGGISPCVATSITFLSCNISPHIKRATALAFLLSIGCLGGVISGQIYRLEDAPRFILGHSINLGFCIMSLIALVVIVIGLHRENRRRDHLYGSFCDETIQSNMNTDQTISNFFAMRTVEDRRRWGYEDMSEEQILNLGDKHAAWRYIL